MLAEVVAGAAARFGDRAAFVTPAGWSLSFRALDEQARSVAAALRDRYGIGEGDVVALLLPSTVDYVVAYVAASMLGAITAGVNPRLTAPERTAIVERAAPALVLATAELADAAPAGVPIVRVEVAADASSVLAALQGDAATVAPLPADPERAECIVFTSGTTGVPKGAEFRDRQLRAIAAMDWGEDRWDGGGAMLAATQLAHVGFMTKLPWYLMSGGATHLLDRWRAPDVLRLLAEQRIAVVGGVAPQLALLLRDPTFDTYDWSHVQLIVMGGGPSSPALVAEARERFGAGYSIRYSSTESGGIGTATAPDADDEEALHTVGRPRPGVEVRIADPDDGAPLPDGEVGEVLVRSPSMLAGWWGDPEATAATIVDGWLRTGDLGRIDERGLLRLAGRAKEMYVRGGYNVYPMEVEAVLGTHPDVAEVAVVAVPDEVMGELGVAVVVPKAGANAPTLEELRAFAADRLAAWKLPERLETRDALPRTPMDKIDRRTLQATVRR